MTISREGSIVGSSGRVLRIIIRGESSLVTSVVGGDHSAIPCICTLQFCN